MDWFKNKAQSPNSGQCAEEKSQANMDDRLNYSRAGAGMSLPGAKRMVSGWTILAGLVLSASAATAVAQYPGLITKTDKSQPVLRSVAVLEWTGAEGKPSASRLVPVAVYDGEQLNDGTIYLTRPEPLALAGGTEYELQTAGKPSGLFDVFGSGEIHGSWMGFGAWKPLTAAAAASSAGAFNTSSLLNPVDAADDDKPVLKRKHPKGTDTDDSAKDSTSTSASGSGIGSSSGTPAKDKPAESDPDRPTLKRKSSDDSTASSAKPAPEVDPDRPTIRRRHEVAEAGMNETSTVAPDPDRPRLKRGKPSDLADTESPRLTGLPPTMQQAVAVSDASNRAEHPWKYNWANPEDEAKMKIRLEALARTALGLDASTAAAKPLRKTARTAASRKQSMMPPAPPVALADEQYRVFELAYGATATLVLTASTPAPSDASTPPADADQPPVIHRGKPVAEASKSGASRPRTAQSKAPKPAPQKFVTLVAQPDLYGGIIVLYKSVTDSAHLDETPRMRLVDAVDAMGDNRGELLFELRGQTQRQFALFRVLRGSAEQLFATVALP
jgi:hypothetical protein